MFKLSDYFIKRELAAEGGDGGAAPGAEPAATPPAASLLGGQPDPAAPPAAPATPTAEPFLQALPGADDKEAWSSLYTKLGRPESAEGYELPVPEGDDGAFAKTTAGWMHEAGLSKQQAQALAGQWNTFQAQQTEAQQAAFEKQQTENVTAIKTEWAANFDANLTAANKALTTFAPEGFVEYLQQTGQANNPMLLNMFLKIGSAISEDRLVGKPKDSSQGGERSLAQALWPDMS